MQAWTSRPLQPLYAAVFIDAIDVKVRDGQVGNRPFYAAIGVDLQGRRDVLGLWAGNGAGESAKFWLSVLTELKNRGLVDVSFIVCDGLKGLPDSANAVFPLATVQTCVIHLIRPVDAQLAREPGYQALLALPGVGPVLAGVFFAEIGDVHRFPTAAHLVSWAGLTPRPRESDATVHRGSFTKQGSTLVRSAAVEAVQKTPADAGWLVARRHQLAARRGANIATVATARKLLTLVYYALRDGHVRALPPAHARSRARLWRRRRERERS